MQLRLLIRRVAATALLLAVSACIVVPRTDELYDEDCQIYVKRMTLEAQQLGYFGGCRGDGCAVMLVAVGAVAAASAVVSGSIVVIGNVVYWAEKQDRCRPVKAASR
jgi:hypothetical protein